MWSELWSATAGGSVFWETDTSGDLSWDSQCSAFIVTLSTVCRETLKTLRVYQKNRWRFCSLFKKWCSPLPPKKYIFKMGGRIYNDFWFGFRLPWQVIWIFKKLRTRRLRVNSVEQDIHNKIICSNMNAFLLPLCSLSDWHFSHLFLHINFEASTWKKLSS